MARSPKARLNVDPSEIPKLLIEAGQRIFEAPAEFIEFSGNREADELLNDLKHYPHAYVIGCIMDLHIRAEKAWEIPHRLRERQGDFEFATLASLTLPQIKRLMTKPEPLHRYHNKMGRNLHAAIDLIAREYEGNAARIWQGRPSSYEVVCRFRRFRGVGPKISSMAANILARELKIPFSDYYSIDISVDVHVRRVFKRLGIVGEDATDEEIVYKARSLSPEFPGLLDFPAWQIGKSWCKPQSPLCGKCYMHDVCPTALKRAVK